MRISDWSSDVCSSDLPEPERLVDTALAQNLDIRQAAARIDEARALRDLAAGRQLPTVAAGASVNRRRQSENGPLPIGTIPGLEASQTIYDAGFDESRSEEHTTELPSHMRISSTQFCFDKKTTSILHNTPNLP